nr:glutamate--tRNA ligase [uncultured Gemmiger sp.]
MANTVRTRFAPSPTGYMHVGNLRTALYTYLQARHNGGTFILRIEDTDQGRLVEGATDIIYNTLRDTGLTWDEGPDIGGPVGPYVQSQRMGMFKQYAEELVRKGKAYYCFCTAERLEALHESQKAAGEVSHYDGHCRNLSEEEVAAHLAAGDPYVIRQKIPTEGKTGFDDLVFGHIEVDNSELDDQILIKSDGMPTYNFANVVDDHLMGITHVIRGSEYLSSAPKYNLLYEAFGWEIPTYIHCPPVMKDAQHKLSKRNGDASYQDLVAKGYLPAAVLNYLLLLGWAPEGEEEIFSLQDMIRIWDPTRISKSPAIFDPLKLRAINAAYIRALPAEEFRRLADPFIDQAVHRDIDRDLLCANLQPRCEVLEDIPPQLDFFDAVLPFDAELYRNKKQKTTPESAKEALEALLPVLEGEADWNRDAIFEVCRKKAEEMEKKNGWLLYPLGIALSGKSRTPGGGTDLAAMLGKEETLTRLRAALAAL